MRVALLGALALLLGGVPVLASGPHRDQDGGGATLPVEVAVDPFGNGVLEPNETAVVTPTWLNAHPNPVTAFGITVSFNGPLGPTYTVSDGNATYALGAFGQGSCMNTVDCYGIRVGVATRPVLHWDTTIQELVTGHTTQTATWRLHVGASFADVPPSSPFYRFVETVLHKNVTAGCAWNAYCPTAPVSRAQMAVFVLVGREAAGYMPPACGATPVFADVPVAGPFCRWVEELARRGVVSGCAPGLFCPAGAVTREMMPVFVLRTLDPALTPPACTAPVFADVPASNPACRWIEELARRGVVAGCGGGNYCPAGAVTREQMAVFLAATFRLPLYHLN